MIVNSKKNKKTADTAESLRFTDVATPRAETLISYSVCVTQTPPQLSLGKQRKDREKPAKREEKKKVCVSSTDM